MMIDQLNAMAMEITPHCVVALTWILKDTLGEELDTLSDPVEFLVGGNDLLPVIEDALQGYTVGATVNLQMEPEQAFGDFNDQLIFLEARALFPADLQEGMVLEGSALPPGCNPDAPRDVLYTVTDMYPQHVVLDGNHPLAGIALRIRMQVRGVRAATQAESACGSCGSTFFKLQTAPHASSTSLH